MKEHHDQHACDTPAFQKGQKVWLDTCNLYNTGIPQKLLDHYARQYPVKRQVRTLAYKLHLPKHVSLLLPHQQSLLPNHHLPEPAPLERRSMRLRRSSTCNIMDDGRNCNTSSIGRDGGMNTTAGRLQRTWVMPPMQWPSSIGTFPTLLAP